DTATTSIYTLSLHDALPIYVTLDLGKLQVAGFVTPTGSRTRIAEEFRVIKRPILLRAFATGEERIESGNLIMVTSAKPGEGKTRSEEHTSELQSLRHLVCRL